MANYIVVNDHPYYPEAAYFDTLPEAEKQRDDWLAEHGTPDGKKEGKVTVAQIIMTKEMRCDY